MTCGGPTSAHDGRDVQVVTVPRDPRGYAQHDVALCAGCRARLADMGLTLRPGRTTDLPVLRDRRRRAVAA